MIAGRRLAAPSWVMAGGILENSRFLAGKVDEVGLCFFQAEACLSYGPLDLPRELASLPLTWHVHLPLDLDWSSPERASSQALALMDKAAFLKARRAVLHPPPYPGAEEMLRVFIGLWEGAGRPASDILLENVPGCSLVDLESLIKEKSLHVCLDMGHVLSHKQEELLANPCLMERVALFHANAPDLKGGSGRHLPLTSLDPAGMETGRRICHLLPAKAVIMAELFSWPHIEASLPILAHWLDAERNK